MAIKFLDSAGLTYFINKIVYGITSPKFSTGSTYTVGKFVIYTGKLYRCTTAVTVAGDWSAAHWTATTVSAELATINSNLTANSTQFYYDYQNSQYGYNTAANRGADTFHPFKNNETSGCYYGFQGITQTINIPKGTKTVYGSYSMFGYGSCTNPTITPNGGETVSFSNQHADGAPNLFASAVGLFVINVTNSTQFTYREVGKATTYAFLFYIMI